MSLLIISGLNIIYSYITINIVYHNSNNKYNVLISKNNIKINKRKIFNKSN